MNFYGVKNPIDYTVLTALSVDELINKAKKACEDGWSPLGGVAVARVQTRAIVEALYLQAMVK